MFRNLVEYRYSECGYFVTLTYDEEHLTSLPYNAAVGLRMPIQSHYQRFLKKLRKRLSNEDTKVRYFLCHEYGAESNRPHYHLLVYLDRWHSLTSFRTLLELCWDNGFVSCDRISDARVHYMTKYVTKQFRNIKTGARTYDYIFRRHWDNLDLRLRYVREFFQKKFSFIRASQGLGTQLLREDSFLFWFYANLRPNEPYPCCEWQGHTYTLPRIYLHKLVPDYWRDTVSPDASPAAYESRLRDLCVDRGVDLPELLRTVHESYDIRAARVGKDHF